MSKSILVIDTPESCLNCRFCRELHKGIEACCELSYEPEDKELCRMIEVDYCQEKPDWCPLWDLPSKANHPDYCDNGRYDKGWNDCIDELLQNFDD